MKKLKVAIIGASGYTGATLIHLLNRHSSVTIESAIARSAGKTWMDADPSLAHLDMPPLSSAEAIDWSHHDFAFFCLPHGASAPLIKEALPHCKVIDLASDMRLKNLAVYEAWYGKHPTPELLKDSVYGLSEHHRAAIKKAHLVACPGCYPTAALLPLKPLVAHGLIEQDIIIDAKSGISGAGKSVKAHLLYGARNENVAPYAIGHHRHLAEIAQELNLPATNLSFTPHLIPMTHGMLATLYVTPTKPLSMLRDALIQTYKNEPFVHICEENVIPETNWVAGSNNCWIGIYEAGKTIVLVSVIDNLIKGASGQAVQNMNIMAGFDERNALL